MQCTHFAKGIFKEIIANERNYPRKAQKNVEAKENKRITFF